MEKVEFNVNDQLDEENIIPPNPNKYPKSAKIIIIVLSIVSFALLLLIILAIVLKKDNNKGKSNQNESDKDKDVPYDLISIYRTAFGGEILYNQTYAKNEVENTFRKGGKNYKEIIGDVNDNKNYSANKYNIYDLYLPYTALKEKKQKEYWYSFMEEDGFEEVKMK